MTPQQQQNWYHNQSQGWGSNTGASSAGASAKSAARPAKPAPKASVTPCGPKSTTGVPKPNTGFRKTDDDQKPSIESKLAARAARIAKQIESGALMDDTWEDLEGNESALDALLCPPTKKCEGAASFGNSCEAMVSVKPTYCDACFFYSGTPPEPPKRPAAEVTTTADEPQATKPRLDDPPTTTTTEKPRLDATEQKPAATPTAEVQIDDTANGQTDPLNVPLPGDSTAGNTPTAAAAPEQALPGVCTDMLSGIIKNSTVGVPANFKALVVEEVKNPKELLTTWRYINRKNSREWCAGTKSTRQGLTLKGVDLITAVFPPNNRFYPNLLKEFDDLPQEYPGLSFIIGAQ